MKTSISAEYRLARLFLLLVCGTAFGVHAQGLLIDQGLQPPPIIPGEGYHYDAADATLLPQTGQEFTPLLNGLDFVNVNLLTRFATNTGIFEVAIHQGNITAPVLGLSSQVLRSGGTTGNNTHFTFPSTIPLTPGDTYVLEVLQIAGNSGWAVEVPGSAVVNGQTIDMSYPGGRLIYGGVPQATEDMIFQEGTVIPEPGAVSLCLLGVLALGFVSKTFSQKAFSQHLQPKFRCSPTTRVHRNSPGLIRTSLSPSVRARLPKGRELCAGLNLTALNLLTTRPVIPTKNILLTEGIYDLICPKDDIEDLWQAWGLPEIWRLPYGHVGICCGMVPGLTERVRRWLAVRLKSFASA